MSKTFGPRYRIVYTKCIIEVFILVCRTQKCINIQSASFKLMELVRSFSTTGSAIVCPNNFRIVLNFHIICSYIFPQSIAAISSRLPATSFKVVLGVTVQFIFSLISFTFIIFFKDTHHLSFIKSISVWNTHLKNKLISFKKTFEEST